MRAEFEFDHRGRRLGDGDFLGNAVKRRQRSVRRRTQRRDARGPRTNCSLRIPGSKVSTARASRLGFLTRRSISSPVPRRFTGSNAPKRRKNFEESAGGAGGSRSYGTPARLTPRHSSRRMTNCFFATAPTTPKLRTKSRRQRKLISRRFSVRRSNVRRSRTSSDSTWRVCAGGWLRRLIRPRQASRDITRCSTASMPCSTDSQKTIV